MFASSLSLAVAHLIIFFLNTGFLGTEAFNRDVHQKAEHQIPCNLPDSKVKPTPLTASGKARIVKKHQSARQFHALLSFSGES